MPCIIIKSKTCDKEINLEEMSRDLSFETEIDLNRINILVDYYCEKDFYKSDDNLIIFIFISELNKKSFIQKLTKDVAALAEQYFDKKQNSSAVICNLIQEGYLLVNGVRR